QRVDALGDLDGDGCGEFGVGSPGEEFASQWQNQGALRILWGFGPSCRSTASFSTVSIPSYSAHVGTAFAGRFDADGDGRDDVLLGAPGYSAKAPGAGTILWLRGADLAI